LKPVPQSADQILNLLIGGEAGQGLVTVGQLLAKALVRAGYAIVVTQSYQSRIRGGHNTYTIRTSPGEVQAPQETVDLLVALNAETVDLHRSELAPAGVIVAGDKFGPADPNCLKVPYSQLARVKFANVVALGAVAALLGLDLELVSRAVADFFGKKDAALLEQNRQALQAAYAWAGTQKVAFPKLAPIKDPVPRLMMGASDAMALGALSAGVKFYSFYPMTPATAIGQFLAGAARRMGLIVEQGEDEIGVLNMALGAAFAGAPAMVGTSGGGFALMVEAVSLAGMTETPVVIALGQRPAPATGLPTRTEQADLSFVLHAGHGEFPRAIFAPGTIAQCFHLTRRAFALTEKYQTPVFILFDQFLADSYRAVASFEVEKLEPIQVGADPAAVAVPYKRYAITDNGVSPRLLPGQSAHLVVADSDEHTEDGHLTEDLKVRKLMVEKRLRKSAGILQEVVAPELVGDEKPELLLVCWGSMRGSALEAAALLRAKGKRVATLHFSQVWPLRAEQFLGILQQAGEVVMVESNAFGQMAQLIRRETGFEIKRKVLRYDGLPQTPEQIVRELSS